ncbi:MAG: hypothetical protein V1776_04680 [Candidatus Diapherotrites archaeon]
MDLRLNKLDMNNFTHRRIAQIIAKCERGEELDKNEGRILRSEVFR